MQQILYRFKFIRNSTGELFGRDDFYVITAVKAKAVIYASTVGEGAFRDWTTPGGFDNNYSIVLTAEGEVYEPYVN